MDLFSKATSHKINSSKARKSMKESTRIPFLAAKSGSYLKAPSYAPSPGAKRLGLHASRPNTATSTEPKARPLTLDKPLPSPPVAQIINPSSPPKVSRTLIDATVAGTPTEQQYPVLRPENVVPENVEVNELLNQPVQPGQNQVLELLQPIFPEQMDSSDDSPLARRHIRRRAIITPGTGFQIESPRRGVSPMPAEPPSTSGSGATPLGETRRGELNMNFRFPLTSSRCPKRGSSRSFMTRIIDVETASSSSESQFMHHTSSAEHLTTVRSVSRSPMTVSEENRDVESGTRVKRLSNHSQASASGLGMVLTISEDADMVILGHQRQTPEVPAVPEVIPNHEVPRERSFSALAGRLSRKRGHASLLARSRPGTPRSLSPVAQETSSEEGLTINNENTQVRAENLSAGFPLKEKGNVQVPVQAVGISNQYQERDPSGCRMGQLENQRLACKPPPVPPKDSPQKATKIPAPQPLSERPIRTLAPVGPHRPSTGKTTLPTAVTPFTTNMTGPTPTATVPHTVTAPKVKLKRSFRKIFRRDAKNSSKAVARAVPVESERSSQITRNSSRVPSSGTVSKAEIPTKADIGLNSNQGYHCANPADSIIDALLASIQRLPEHSAERQRAVETAEAMVSSIEHSKEAKTAAAQAEMFAKKAEEHANASEASLQRFVALVGSGLDSVVAGGFIERFEMQA